MRYLSVGRRLFVRFAYCLVVVSSASFFAAFPGPASADTFYRWQDGDGNLHFSNRPGRVPSGAQIAGLPALGLARRPATARPAGPAEVVASAPRESIRPRQSECGAPDTTRLINAVTSSIPESATRGPGGQDPELTLFVAAKPISYGEDAELEIVPGQNWNDPTEATAQGAVAYPASGGCPRTPPLARYAVASERGRVPSSGRCDDFRGAFTEIDIALRHNESVARTFQFASERFSDVATSDGVFRAVGTEITLPTWLAQVNAAQTAELAAETQEFLDELSVAREEIDRAAQTLGCW